jgi:hypothetical protein
MYWYFPLTLHRDLVVSVHLLGRRRHRVHIQHNWPSTSVMLFGFTSMPGWRECNLRVTQQWLVTINLRINTAVQKGEDF